MKRLAIFIGGLLVLPAFAEVAPVFYDDIEYSDVAYDEYGNPIYYTDYDTENLTPETDVNVTMPSVQTSRNAPAARSNTNRTTIGRNLPTSTTTAATGRASAANSSRAVAARTTSNSSPRTATTSRSVASRGTTTSRTTSTAATRATSNTAATNAAATRATGGAGRTTATATRNSSGASVARTTTRASSGRNTTSSRTATTGARVNRAATVAKVSANSSSVMPAGVIRGTTVNAIPGTSTTLTDSGNPLYISRSGRDSVSVASSRIGMNNRVPTIRMASTGGLSTSEVSVTAADLAEMDELAELTDYCKAQYAACMDNYCNVLDDNQGRCSCSANLKNYAAAEAALKSATEELQEVAQKIQYIGLSAREVETLFSATEAELKMQTTVDTTQLKTSLDKIRDMIIDVQSGNATSSSNSSFLSFDLSGLLDFTIDSTGFDISSFLGNFGTNGNTINNQRGEELFKTATNRCRANVLRACTAQGVDASLITNAYDLEIDKECIIYERSLSDSNDQMVATVRNAKSVLQKARLLVEQSKNEYDMRGCINALDACMQDEYVCGSDYEKCLDPSGRYIVNGEIVIGTDPGRAVNGVGTGSVGVLDGDICSMNLYNVWNYGDSTPGQTNSSQSGCKNAWNSWSHASGNGNLSEYINTTLGNHEGLGMSQYIQAKIGWRGTGKDSDKNYGMCMSVLNKCQDYTYTGTGSSRKYNEKNEVIKQYLERMLVQIKAKQDQLLSEHAESCITDVQTCLSQNGYPFDEEGNTGGTSVAANIAINACRSTIVTCMSVNGYSVDNPTPTELSSWVCGITTGTTDCSGINPDDQPTPSGNYTVTYNCNGGTGSISSQSVIPGASVVLPSATACSKSGYILVGWQCGANSLSPNSNFTPTATTVCRANWQINGGNQTITWSTSRGSTSGCPRNYTFSDSNQSVICNVGSVSGWVFQGWCRTDNPSICSTSSNLYRVIIPGNWTQPISFTGTWKQLTEDPVWVTFNVNDQNCGANNPGCILDSDPKTLYYQTNRNIDDTCPTGWYVAADCQSSKLTRLTDGPVSENANCVYQGHFNAASGGTQYIANDYKFNNNIPTSGGTLYAHWNCEDGGGDTVFSNHNKELTFTDENL